MHTVDTDWATARLTHGYASTVHKAQGQAHEVTIIVGSPALTAETAYTALSRGRGEHQLHLTPHHDTDPAGGVDADGIDGWLTEHTLTDTSRRQHLAGQHTRPQPAQPIRPYPEPRRRPPARQEGPTR